MSTAGGLDRPIEIQEQQGTTFDGAGQEIENWVTVWTPSARVVPSRGGERFAAQQVIGKKVITFEIRYRPGVTEDKHRILFDGVTYDIDDVREVGRQAMLHIDVTEA